MTNRLRRNLMAAAALIIAIVHFNIQVGRAAAQGMALEGVTTDVVLWILIAVLVHHAIAFALRPVAQPPRQGPTMTATGVVVSS